MKVESKRRRRNDKAAKAGTPYVLMILLLVLAVAPRAGAVWQLTWSDEFTNSTIDSSKWAFETGNSGGWGNQEREYYTARTNNAFVANGMLHIVARQESFGGFPYTSARMKTQGLYSHKYGRIEWRASLPQGRGFWPALWLLGNNISSAGWPACGEIDVMENNYTMPNQAQGTIHYSDASNNHLQQTKIYTLPTSGDSVTNFHTYAIEWTTNSIKWLVDSNVVQTWTSWSSSTGPYPAPYNQPFFLLMNVAIGGTYIGTPSDATINSGTVFPGEMVVDYVRVYDDVPVSGPPGAPNGVSASQGGGTVYLNWSGVSGATAYNVKRATSSGGAYTLIATTAATNLTDTGVSPCASYYYIVTATNSFGESTNSAEVGASVSPWSFSVNAGGSAANQFVTDVNFSGGTQAAPVTTVVDTSAVTGPAPQAVYQTERFGNFTYTFTGLMSGASYKVRLHFAETYWTSTGQRRFNVILNGAQVLSNFDIVAAAGAPNKANVQEFNAVAQSGQVTVQFVTVTDNAKVSGIEIILPATASPSAGNNSPVYETATLTLTASTVPNASYQWSGPNGFSSSVQSPVLTRVSTAAAGTYSVSATVLGCAGPPATTSVAVLPRPVLSAAYSGNTLRLTSPGGTLQEATNSSGPWIDLGSGPLTTNIVPAFDQEFFRIRVQ